MHSRRFARLFLVALATIGVLPGFASADLVMELSQAYNGATPYGDAPWARATFEDVTGGVQLTMENLMAGTNQFITQWAFNIADEGLLPNLVFDFQETALFGEPDFSYKANGFKTQGTGNETFDFGFGFAKGNGQAVGIGRFTPDTTFVYMIRPKEGSGVTVSSSLFNATNTNGLLTSAHIQGIPVAGEPGMTTSGAATVPEPSMLVLWSILGVTGIGAMIVRRRRGAAR